MAKKKVSTHDQRAQYAAAQRLAAAQKKRTRIIIAVVGFVVIALIPVTVVISQMGGVDPTPPVNTDPTSTSGSTPGIFIPPNGTEEMGWISVTSPNLKPDALIVSEHIDYQCVHCRHVTGLYGETFMQLAERGDIILRVHIRSFMDGNWKNSGSTRASMGSTCADVVGRFGPYHEILFANTPVDSSFGFTDQQLRVDFAAQAGITGEDLTTFQTCFDQEQTKPYIQQMELVNSTSRTINGGNQPPPQGTPAFYVNGNQMYFKDMVGKDEAANVYVALLDTSPDGFLAYLKTIANQQ